MVQREWCQQGTAQNLPPAKREGKVKTTPYINMYTCHAENPRNWRWWDSIHVSAVLGGWLGLRGGLGLSQEGLARAKRRARAISQEGLARAKRRARAIIYLGIRGGIGLGLRGGLGLSQEGLARAGKSWGW